MGWGRCSCKYCIFGNKNQFASANFISPEQVAYIAYLEQQFGCTINRKCDLYTLISNGEIYESITEELVKMDLSYDYEQPIFIPEGEQWLLPAGAYGENCGAP